MSDWIEKLIELESAVLDNVKSPRSAIEPIVEKLKKDLKPFGAEAMQRFEATTGLMLDAMTEFANREIDEEHLKIALSKYKETLKNYADGVKIKAMKSVADSLEKKLIGYLPTLIRLIG